MFDLIKKIIIKVQKAPTNEPQPLLVSLLHCLYEAQDPASLCKSVVQLLGHRMNLSYNSLNPADSYALGYFLSYVPLTSNIKEFKVDLENCLLGDAGIKSLIQSICKHIESDSHHQVGTHLIINLWDNEIHEEGALHIAEILKNTRIVSKLWIGGNPIGDQGLRAILNALKQNVALKGLLVSYCSLSNTGVALLASALHSNNTLETLDIRGNKSITEDGLTYLVEALSKHSGMVKLDIPYHLNADQVSKMINEARRRNGLSNIEVWY